MKEHSFDSKPVTNTYEDIIEESWLMHTIEYATKRLKYLQDNSEVLKKHESP